MATFKGKKSLNYLHNHINDFEKSASSHWQQYHQSFKFENNSFYGIQGFGGYSPNWTTPIHKFMQLAFSNLTNNFSAYKKLNKIAKQITNAQKRAYDLDVLRQVLTLSYLKSKIPLQLNSDSIACVIGDGFASMTSLLLKSKSAKLVILINLKKTLMVDLYFLKALMGQDEFEKGVSLVTDKDSLSKVLSEKNDNDLKLGKIIAIQAEHHDLIKNCHIDIAINIASMQEMNLNVISGYFQDLRAVAAKNKILFYCANREQKELPDGTIIRFYDYPWSNHDKIISDEICPWHRFYYKLIPPFYYKYDGPIRHRLVELSPIMKSN
jgi:putative sugar O-methyltransferase